MEMESKIENPSQDVASSHSESQVKETANPYESTEKTEVKSPNETSPAGPVIKFCTCDELATDSSPDVVSELTKSGPDATTTPVIDGNADDKSNLQVGTSGGQKDNADVALENVDTTVQQSMEVEGTPLDKDSSLVTEGAESGAQGNDQKSSETEKDCSGQANINTTETLVTPQGEEVDTSKIAETSPPENIIEKSTEIDSQTESAKNPNELETNMECEDTSKTETQTAPKGEEVDASNCQSTQPLPLENKIEIDKQPGSDDKPKESETKMDCEDQADVSKTQTLPQEEVISVPGDKGTETSSSENIIEKNTDDQTVLAQTTKPSEHADVDKEKTNLASVESEDKPKEYETKMDCEDKTDVSKTQTLPQEEVISVPGDKGTETSSSENIIEKNTDDQTVLAQTTKPSEHADVDKEKTNLASVESEDKPKEYETKMDCEDKTDVSKTQTLPQEEVISVPGDKGTETSSSENIIEKNTDDQTVLAQTTKPSEHADVDKEKTNLASVEPQLKTSSGVTDKTDVENTASSEQIVDTCDKTVAQALHEGGEIDASNCQSAQPVLSENKTEVRTVIQPDSNNKPNELETKMECEDSSKKETPTAPKGGEIDASNCQSTQPLPLENKIEIDKQPGSDDKPKESETKMECEDQTGVNKTPEGGAFSVPGDKGTESSSSENKIEKPTDLANVETSTGETEKTHIEGTASSEQVQTKENAHSSQKDVLDTGNTSDVHQAGDGEGKGPMDSYQYLKCKVCNEIYSEPVILPCSHIVCRWRCANKLFTGTTVTCALCSVKSIVEGGVQSLPLSQTFSDLIQEMKPTVDSNSPQVSKGEELKTEASESDKCDQALTTDSSLSVAAKVQAAAQVGNSSSCTNQSGTNDEPMDLDPPNPPEGNDIAMAGGTTQTDSGVLLPSTDNANTNSVDKGIADVNVSNPTATVECVVQPTVEDTAESKTANESINPAESQLKNTTGNETELGAKDLIDAPQEKKEVGLTETPKIQGPIKMNLSKQSQAKVEHTIEENRKASQAGAEDDIAPPGTEGSNETDLGAKDLIDAPQEEKEVGLTDSPKTQGPIKMNLSKESQAKVEHTIEENRKASQAEAEDDEAPPGTEGAVILKTGQANTEESVAGATTGPVESEATDASTTPIMPITLVNRGRMPQYNGSQTQTSSCDTQQQYDYSNQNWNSWNWQQNQTNWGQSAGGWNALGATLQGWPGQTAYTAPPPKPPSLKVQAQQYAQQYNQWQQNFNPSYNQTTNQYNQFPYGQAYQQNYYNQSYQQSNWYGNWAQMQQQQQQQQQNYQYGNYQTGTQQQSSYQGTNTAFSVSGSHTSSSITESQKYTNVISVPLSTGTVKAIENIPLPPPTPAEPHPTSRTNLVSLSDSIPPPLPAYPPPNEPAVAKPPEPVSIPTDLTKEEIAAQLLRRARKKTTPDPGEGTPSSKYPKIDLEGGGLLLAGESAPQRHLYIGNLPGGTKAAALRDMLADYGRVVTCKVAAGKGQNAGIFAFVTLETPTDANALVSTLNGSHFSGVKLKVKKLKNLPGGK